MQRITQNDLTRPYQEDETNVTNTGFTALQMTTMSSDAIPDNELKFFDFRRLTLLLLLASGGTTIWLASVVKLSVSSHCTLFKSKILIWVLPDPLSYLISLITCFIFSYEQRPLKLGF